VSNPIRIVLADDHPVVRAGIRATLDAQPDIEVLAEGDNGRDAQTLSAEHQPDILVLDLSMPGPQATDTIHFLKTHAPNTRVLMLTAHDDDTYIRQVMRAGVAGYLLKEEAPDTIIKAVHAIQQGAAWFSQSVADKFMQWQFGREPELGEAKLTGREKDILALIAKGWNNTKIAEHLGLAEQTVRNYTSSLYEKIEVSSRAEAVVWARDHGFEG
jgi:DNA-binding NarL/FixJ family response regulator